MKRTPKYAIIAAATTIFAVLPFIGVRYIDSHDGFFHLDRLVLFDHALRQGCLYPRWIQELAHGYGMPMFNYYPPLSYYFAEFFHLLGFDFPTSISAAFVIGFVLSGIAMFLFAKELLGEVPALVAAVAYIYAPYHLLDAYVRGAMPEFLAFVFLPLIFYSILKAEKKTYHYPLISLFYALLILTHNVMAMISTPFIILFILIQKNRKNSLIFLLLGLGLTSFYMVPAVSELRNIHPITTYRYTDHFLYPFQLFEEKWDFGLSVPGPNDEMSFHIGNIHLAFSILALYLLSKGDKQLKKHLLYFFALLLVSAFFTLGYSMPIARFIPFFGFIQFPWRFLFLTSFAVSFLSAGFIKIFKEGKDQKLVASMLLILFIVYALPLTQIIPPSDEKLEMHSTYQAVKLRGPKTVVGTVENELLPRWVNDYSELVIKDRVPWPAGTVSAGCNSYRIEGNFSEGQRITLPIFYFPGWKAKINDKDWGLAPNENGLITLHTHRGYNRISIGFGDTTPRNVGKILSILSLLILGIYSARNRIRSQIIVTPNNK